MSLDEIYEMNGIPVDVMEVNSGKFDVYRVFSGTIRGMRQSELSTSISTRVLEIRAGEGDRVKEGDIIMILDPDDPGKSTGDYRQSRARYLQALRDYERMKELYESGAVSKQDYENARTSYEVESADFKANKDMVDISTPIDGILTEITLNEGDPVSPGETLATVAVIDKVRVELNLSSGKAQYIKRGQPARIVLNNSPVSAVINGVVETISLSANKETGLFEAKILFENPDALLKPGTIAKVEILVYSNETTLAVPIGGLISSNGGYYIFVVASDNKAEKREVTLGWEGEEEVEITDGLKKGELVVVNGQNKLEDGDLVYIHSEVN
jgi:RND family efflux transporter MFP subunit